MNYNYWSYKFVIELLVIKILLKKKLIYSAAVNITICVQKAG